MKTKFVVLTLLCALGLFVTCETRAEGNIKLAQSGMQFVSVVSDAHAAAMAGAMTTVPLRSASLFFNPACMAETKTFVDVSASYNQWIADIKHSAFSVAVSPANGDYGVFGLTAQVVDYGEILGTRVSAAPLGYDDTGALKPTAAVFGFGYAKSLSEAFSIGGQIKLVRQNLGWSLVPGPGDTETTKKYKASVIAFDFGTLFKTGLKSLAFGMSVRNFSREITYESESFPLPLSFTIGVSMDGMDLLDERSIVRSVMISVDAIHNRDYREQVFIGADCNLLDVFSIRGGYISGSDEAGATVGFGVHQFGVEADYAYTPFGVFDKVQRVTLRFSM